MIDVRTRHPGRLTSPVRNRYFYGKLLDVEHLEREQSYFVERSRLINRLTLGAGVLCGLGVRDRDGEIVVSPGVAVDGCGREIVVTEPFIVEDPWTLTDACGDATGETRENGPVVLCLAYHECLVEPAPVLVSDCEIREECEHGAVRERYRLLVHAPEDVELPRPPCYFTQPDEPVVPGGVRPEPVRPERESLRPELLSFRGRAFTPGRSADELVRAAIREEVGVRPVGRATGLRERLCAVLRTPCEPGAHCVPLALVTRDDAGGLVIDPCATRTTIYSNAVLLDLILCLAEQMERCCDRRVTVTAPVVVDVYPPPAVKVTVAEVRDRLGFEAGGVAISFSRAMNQARLDSPDEWLRLVALAASGEVVRAGTARAFPVPLELDRTEETTLDGSEGFTAYYRFRPIEVADPTPTSVREEAEVSAAPVAGADLLELIESAGLAVRFLLVARSDDVTQIVDAEDQPELLDADYAGTRLEPSMLDLFWDLSQLLPVLPGSLLGAIGFPSGESPPNLPSGNGIEGGVFHTYFDVTPTP